MAFNRQLSVLLLLAACHGKPDDTAPYRHHPDGWTDPAQHGMAAKYQDQACAACHGEDLLGGSAGQSCDTCHAQGWRTDCTFCHGGDDNATGAPPIDIDGQSTDLAFAGHTAHVEAIDHAAWTCEQCHATPTDVLSPGHLFLGDATPGLAEIAFVGGLSAAGTYDGSGSCSNLYCHGNGAGELGAVQMAETLDCAGCHGDAVDVRTLSGVHPQHLGQGAACGECHAATATGSDTISGPAMHVDGEVETEFPSGMVYAEGTCTGTCHDVAHTGATWTGGTFHPAGWEAPDQHGMAAKFQVQECTTCHGQDLTGGTIAPTGCDSCHLAGWRTNCTYCHGGTDDTTGAPPVGIDGSDTLPFFQAHNVHVDGANHAAWDCEQCHTKPDDVLSAGHLFLGDASPGVAELAFADGLSPEGAYGGDGSCSNLYCHGDGGDVLGAVTSDTTTTCGSCHGTAATPGTLSTVHVGHLAKGALCGECHADTATGNDAITGPELHVDGEVENAFPSGMVYANGTCTGTCHGAPHEGSRWTADGFHPVGWNAVGQHGLAANLQLKDCTPCHGADLTGGTSGSSCDSCHVEGWRTNCTYCHGGTDNTTGAPPVDIDGTVTLLTFAAHTVHVEEGNHAAWSCDQCHVAPLDVLSAGHIFVGDTTPGAAEVDFADGLSADGVYVADGSCGNLYCHGDGAAALGSVTPDITTDCGSCHGSATAPGTLSTVHDNHLAEGATCGECHAGTATGSDAISGPALHVDGDVETSFPSGMVFANGTCTGSCHGMGHDSATWTDGGFHAPGWAQPEQHGVTANLKEQDCRVCHGADLTGGASGQSCDECHTAGWRTDCTYCHGGTDNATGAPPVDIDGLVTALSFVDHTVHVEETIHPAWDCVQCHVKPVDVLSLGHVFAGDVTPGKAEVRLTSGLSTLGHYDGAGTCSNLYCHGNGSKVLAPRILGTVTAGTTATCGSCHGTASNTSTMSGQHWRHLDQDIQATCDECHATTVSDNTTISNPLLHVNGVADKSFPSGMVRTGNSCTGTCHNKVHSAWVW